MNSLYSRLQFVPKCVNNIRTLTQAKFRPKSEFRVVEVGPRDGLQNESVNVPTDIRIEFINMLSKCGLSSIEVTSFVSPRKVPQMADGAEVLKGITKDPNIRYPVLVPNMKGFDAAMEAGATEIAIFGSASQAFSYRNMSCSIEESLEKFREVTDAAREKNIKVRGYVSCVTGCPYEGAVTPYKVAKMTAAMMGLGCYEISLGDTIGVGTVGAMKRMLKEVAHVSTPEFLALHCHDTYGQALANVLVGLEEGITCFDSSVGGLGGCPFAKGATGNLATEDLVYMMQGFGVPMDIDLLALIKAGRFICKHLGKEPRSRVNTSLWDKVTNNEQILELAMNVKSKKDCHY